VSSKATYDGKNVYFMVQTKKDLTPYTDPAWMRLLLEVADKDGKEVTAENWESFQYIVNRQSPKDEEHATLEQSKGGWEWEAVGEVSYNASGKTLQIAIPRKLLGIGDCASFTVNFKWSDNMQNDGDILDFYENGDVAPEGRYKYSLSVCDAPIGGEETEVETDGQTTHEPTVDDNMGADNKGMGPLPIIAAAAAVAAVGIVIAVMIKKKKK
jgi:antitoxin component YwqK of YwqJK toxin-antitoxin module